MIKSLKHHLNKWINNKSFMFIKNCWKKTKFSEIYFLNRYTIPIDHVGFEFEVLCDSESGIHTTPEDGKYFV